jgi:hypothetical protein
MQGQAIRIFALYFIEEVLSSLMLPLHLRMLSRKVT